MKFKLNVSIFEVVILFVLLLIILLRYLFSRPNYKDGDVLKITSTVYSEPIVYEDSQYINLQGLKIYLPKYPEVSYGDKIVVIGKVFKKEGKGFFLNDPELISKIENENFMYRLRQELISIYKYSLPEPYASLVGGIILGSKNMPQSFWEQLKQTGTAHVVVASGTNVSMLATFLMATLTYFFNRRHAVFITLAGIAGYIILSGLDAPIVRAGIMGSIAFLAQLTGRVSNSWRILIITSLIMLLIKPIWLIDIGFILSFVATSSLMLFQNKINEKLKFVPNILKEGLSTSLAAQIGVAPILFVTFGQFNIISPIINAFILWTVNYIMIFGALGGIISLIAPVVGRIILLFSFPFLYWFVKIIEMFSM